MDWRQKIFPTSRNTGQQAEALAANYLRGQGLRLLHKNYTCRRGEIDLIMADAEHLVFVEVKYRHSNTFGLPQEAVTQTKQHRMTLAAAHYLQQQGFHQRYTCRFDVIALQGTPGVALSKKTVQIDWLKNAFYAQ